MTTSADLVAVRPRQTAQIKNLGWRSQKICRIRLLSSSSVSLDSSPVSDDLVCKQGRDQCNADQTAQKNQVSELFDARAQSRPIRIPDREI
jgi:hypothetical protein